MQPALVAADTDRSGGSGAERLTLLSCPAAFGRRWPLRGRPRAGSRGDTLVQGAEVDRPSRDQAGQAAHLRTVPVCLSDRYAIPVDAFSDVGDSSSPFPASPSADVSGDTPSWRRTIERTVACAIRARSAT